MVITYMSRRDTSQRVSRPVYGLRRRLNSMLKLRRYSSSFYPVIC